MSFEVIQAEPFSKEFKRLHKKFHSLKKDLTRLTDELESNPFIGVDLGGGLRKVRMAITSKGKGKSHGARVITYTTAVVNVDEEGLVTLVYLYDKGERDSISAEEIASLLKGLL